MENHHLGEVATGPRHRTFEFRLITCVGVFQIEKTRKRCSNRREQHVRRSYEMPGSLNCLFNYDCLFD